MDYDVVVRPLDVNKLRTACQAAADTLKHVIHNLQVGMTTAEVDRMVHDHTVRKGGYPAPLNYKGYPKSCCVSVNDVVCHGIPGPYVLQDGDVVNVDVTTIIDGHFGDTNATIQVGTPTEAGQRLILVTYEAMWEGVKAVRPGAMLGEVGAAIQQLVEANGYGVVREFGGHGIGTRFHTDPWVSHVGTGKEGPRLVPGMVFTIEPMVTLGSPAIILDPDGWTARTQDGSLSAQFEMTVLVTETGHEVLTL